MAAKKKTAPVKQKPPRKPARQPAKPAKAAAKPAKTTAKPGKPAAKPVTATAKPVTATAKPAKATVKLSKSAKPAKPMGRASKPAESGGASLAKTVRRAAAKVAQAVTGAAAKLMDSDVGRPAPGFELLDETGETLSSSSLAGKPYMLYFYPKDDTPGCTKEACDIRDNFGKFGKQGLRVLGVSPDAQKSHAKFRQKYGIPFTLLSDPEKTLATAYGVWGKKQNYGKEYMGIIRSSFLIGADGLIKKAYRGVSVDGHIDAVLNDAKSVL